MADDEKLLTVTLTADEYRQHTESYDGGCGEWTFGGVEPDARKYKCDACDQRMLYGAEWALTMGCITFVDGEEES